MKKVKNIIYTIYGFSIHPIINTYFCFSSALYLFGSAVLYTIATYVYNLPLIAYHTSFVTFDAVAGTPVTGDIYDNNVENTHNSGINVEISHIHDINDNITALARIVVDDNNKAHVPNIDICPDRNEILHIEDTAVNQKEKKPCPYCSVVKDNKKEKTVVIAPISLILTDYTPIGNYRPYYVQNDAITPGMKQVDIVHNIGKLTDILGLPEVDVDLPDNGFNVENLHIAQSVTAVKDKKEEKNGAIAPHMYNSIEITPNIALVDNTVKYGGIPHTLGVNFDNVANVNNNDKEEEIAVVTHITNNYVHIASTLINMMLQLKKRRKMLNFLIVKTITLSIGIPYVINKNYYLSYHHAAYRS